jgi:hypothetical protein
MNMPTEEEGENVIVAKFPKNNHEVICAGISDYKGKKYVFFRVFVPSLDGLLTPTQSGISLAIEKCDELVKGVRDLGEVMNADKVVARINLHPNLRSIWR